MNAKKETITPTLSVIVLTFNSQGYVRRCLSSLKKSIEHSEVNIEVIVVDNDSVDKTKEILKTEKFIQLYLRDNNYGFAKSINYGIQHSKGELILILNPDTILKQNSIKNLLNYHIESKSDITGGKTVKRNGLTHGSYVKRPNIYTLLFDYTNLRKLVPGDIFHRRHYYHELGVLAEPTPVDAVSGSYMLISRKVINKIGLLDENFFMYLEDIDFCVRAGKQDFRVTYCPNSVITHIGGSSSKNEDKINHRAWYYSRKYYAQKNFDLLTNIIIQPIFFIDEVISTIWSIIK